jgi:hypothetical protein
MISWSMLVIRLPDVPHGKFKWASYIQSVMEHEALLPCLKTSIY